jgi:predicted glutamine amidotransferase
MVINAKTVSTTQFKSYEGYNIMCVIICCDRKSGNITKKMLKNAEESNNDGMGIAWINKDNKVQWVKGLNSKNMMKLIKRLKPSLKRGYIVHARIASIGDVCPSLTHPFEISKNANDDLTGESDVGVLFHNGTWTDYEEYMMKTLIKTNTKMYDGKNSDSRSMAFLAHNFGVNFLSLITDQKIAVLTPKGIKRFGKFPKVNNFMCSNGYFNMKNSYQSYGYNDDDFEFGEIVNNSTRYQQKSYCESCDRELFESCFTFDYDICDKCFKSKKVIDDIQADNMINAKEYLNKQESWYNAHGKTYNGSMAGYV